MTEDRDVIYIVNKYSTLTTFNWKGTKILFPRYVPVQIDFTDDPELIKQLMDFPQLSICTKKEMAKYETKKVPKIVKQESTTEDVVDYKEEDSE